MESDFILVWGAAGNLGGKVANALLAAGANIAVAGRSYNRLRHFEGKAAILEGDFADDAFVRDAFLKSKSAFLTVPDAHLANPAATAARLGELIDGTPVTHLVNISNCITKRAGKLTRLVALEQELDKLPHLHIKHLRCANFFENLNWGLHTPYLPELQLPYISSYEVAFVTAQHLLSSSFSGKSTEVLLGRRHYSMAQLAAAAGEKYKQLPYTPANEFFYRPFNEGDFEMEPRTDQNTSTLANEEFTLEYFLTNDFVKQS